MSSSSDPDGATYQPNLAEDLMLSSSSDDEESDVSVGDLPQALTTERGSRKIAYRGHAYVTPTVLADGVSVSWRCEHKLTCSTRLHTEGMDGGVLRMVGRHNHLGDPNKARVLKFKQTLKERASASLEPPMNLLGAVVEQVPDEIQQQGPSKNAIRMLVHRQRSKTMGIPANPSSRADIDVPDNLAHYVTGDVREKFLLADSGKGDPDRILFFGRESASDSMAYITALYVDATFSITPPLFSQVFVVTGRRGSFVQPLLYILLPGRTTEVYKRMYAMLKERFPDLSPTAIYLDFEFALITATRSAFPDARLNGCFYHLRQAVQRHLTGGVKKLYETNVTINLHVRMIVALAFVPINRLRAYVDVLRGSVDRRISGLLNYFEETYVGARKKTLKRAGNTTITMVVRKEPRYSPSFWSLRERIQTGDDATNNYSEISHSRCRAHLNVDHPGVWRFISVLQGLQRVLDFDYNKHCVGQQNPVKKKQRGQIEMRNERIRNVMEDIEGRSDLDYLKGIAMNLQL